MKKTVVLAILDGYGIAPASENNAISLAEKPNIDKLFANYPNTLLQASGLAVGLPEGQMGNSEVGHLNIGAGRVVYQALTLIDAQIKSGHFFKTEAFLKAINHVKKNKSNLHIFGLLSDGGVHSHINHIIALIDLAKSQNVSNVYIHAFLDGRDVEPDSAPKYIRILQEHLKKINFGVIMTVSGRFYAMDRDKNFDRLDKAYGNLTLGSGIGFDDPLQFVLDQHKQGVFDEFVVPGCNNHFVPLASDDAIIYANFRPDRAIQLSTVITNPSLYPNYVPNPKLQNICLIQMFKYADSVRGDVAFAIEPLDNILGTYLADNNLTQLRIAETEKYAHVTFFFDGGVNYDGVARPIIAGCDRILVDSPKVTTYDLRPEMSIYEVCDKACAAVVSGKYDVIILNFANCDMVGHTAVKDAVIQAVEHVDACVGKLADAIEKVGGTLVLTADHGNADKIAENNQPFTAHTTAMVPFLIAKLGLSLRNGAILADIAPTLLHLLNLKQPKEMSGVSIIKS